MRRVIVLAIGLVLFLAAPAEAAFEGRWSPGGRRIAYIAGVSGGPGSLVVMKSDGTSPTTLVKQNVLGMTWQRIPAGRRRSIG